jgi:external thioesterase TEII
MQSACSQQRTTLFLVPFAGGSQYSYYPYKKHFGPNIDFCPIDLPGRGRRANELPRNVIHDVVDDVYASVMKHGSVPYALFGHSFGALISFLVTKKIINSSLEPPVHLFVSGRAAPSVKTAQRKLHQLPKDHFFEKLIGLGGLPTGVLENKEMLNYFEPIIRADLQASEEYEHVITTPVPVPITAFYGEEEDLAPSDVDQWKNETSCLPISVHRFSGNHFFIFNHFESLSKIIEQNLQKHAC